MKRSKISLYLGTKRVENERGIGKILFGEKIIAFYVTKIYMTKIATRFSRGEIHWKTQLRMTT